MNIGDFDDHFQPTTALKQLEPSKEISFLSITDILSIICVYLGRPGKRLYWAHTNNKKDFFHLGGSVG